MSGILIWSFEDGSVVTASYVPRWRSHMCTMYVFLLFGRNAQDVTRGFFSWPFRKKGRLDRVDRWIMGYSFRTFFFFFAEPLISSTDNHLSISDGLTARVWPSIKAGQLKVPAVLKRPGYIGSQVRIPGWMDRLLGLTWATVYSGVTCCGSVCQNMYVCKWWGLLWKK